MALKLISSNRVESLQGSLSDCLALEPLPDPFTAEIIIVPGMAMARWVNLQLARSLGVAANIDYRLPADWVWHLTATVLPDVPEQDPLAMDRAAWRIHACLPDCLDDPDFEALRHYLENDRNGLRRWQLAQRIADVFDRYQYYRPDWIRAWSAGDDARAQHAWQPKLWRELTCSPDLPHRVGLIDRLLESLQPGEATIQLPTRISLFAQSSLPPLFVKVFQALSAHCNVYLYQHSPTDQYWADLSSKKQQARRRLEQPDQAQYHDAGNELLVSWGRQGQAFQDLLLEAEGLDAAHEEQYQPPGNRTLLQSLQQSIFDIDSSRAVVALDDSLQVSICHSPLRECQVLHDQLLRELQADPTLKPEDILVMVPDISRYAPYIEAVFRSEESGSRPFIPWNLSDTSLADEHPLLVVFFRMLQLPGSRFRFSEILSLLEVPEIAARFDLGGDDGDHLHQLLDRANLRWGLDGEHKRELDLPAMDANTWQQSLDRLFAGHALGDIGEDALWHGLAPLPPGDGQSAELLGRLGELLLSLRQWRSELDVTRSARQWQVCLARMLDTFFQPLGEDDERLQQIRDVIGQLADAAEDQEISPELLRHWLETELGEQSRRGRFFSGGVTFCGMRPMRSMPFRIICLSGMNDQDFPRRDTTIEFDAMAGDWRPGDPRRRDEDRYLLLETLLCARQKLYFSYVGRSLKDNEERQPSVLLRELLDHVDEHFLPDVEQGRISDHLCRTQSMQAFNERNFRGDRASHDRYWCKVARGLQSGPDGEEDRQWGDMALPIQSNEEPVIELSQMIRFLRNPSEQFVRQRLRIHLRTGDEVDDKEMFDPDPLQRWQLSNRVLHAMLEGRNLPLQRLEAEGQLPHGSQAALTLKEMEARVQPMLVPLEHCRGQRPEKCRIRLGMPGGRVLQGAIERYYPGIGLVYVTVSKCKGIHLLEAWIEHLALCAKELLRPGERGEFHSLNKQWYFPRLSVPDALEQLQCYVSLYQEGLQRPLPVFAGSSFAFAEQLLEKGKSEEDALRSARSQWLGGFGIQGDVDDLYVRLLHRGGVIDPLLSDRFPQYAQQMYARLLLDREKT